MTVRRILGVGTHRPLRNASRFVRLASAVLVSTIGLWIIQAPGASAPEDDADHEKSVVFRHFV